MMANSKAIDEDSSAQQKADTDKEDTSAQKHSLHALPSTTVRLLGSSQVITSVSSAVKELIENALDAGSTSVEIKLEQYGLEKIEVRDNGCGIPVDEMNHVAKHYHTSKIRSFQDLELLDTYGFRGEALGSLCSVSNLTITSKTEEDDVGTVICVNHQGEITSSKPSHFGRGTCVTATNLFKNLPVRKQFYSTAKKKREELKHVEDLVMSYGVIRPDIRISLRHNKDLVWQKFAVMDHRTVLLNVLGTATFNELEKKVISHDDPKNLEDKGQPIYTISTLDHAILREVTYGGYMREDHSILDSLACGNRYGVGLTEMEIEAFVPKAKCKVALTSRANGDRHLTFVNKRPVVLKEVNKIFRQFYTSHHSNDDSASSRYPIYFLSVVLPSGEVDVNVEPNKTKVMVEHQDVLLRTITKMLETHYEPTDTTTTTVSKPEACIADCGRGKTENNNDILPHVNKQVQRTCENGEDRTVRNSNNTDSSSSKMDGESTDQMEKSKGLSNDSKTFHQDDLSPSQEDAFGSFEIEILTPVKDGEDNMHAIQPPVSSDKVIPKGDNSAKGNNSATPCDISRKLSQKEEAFQDLLDDLNSDDILCTFDDGSGQCSAQGSENVFVRKEISSPQRSKGKSDDVIDEPAVSGDAWSRGRHTDSTGKIIQGSAVLLPTSSTTTTLNTNGKRPSSPSQDGTDGPSSKKPSLIKAAETTMFDLISSQPIKRPQTAFIHFSREVRPKVVQENPGASFQEIARITGQKWQELTEEGRRKYTEMTTKDVERYRQQMSATKELVNKGRKKAEKPSKRASLSIKDCLLGVMSPSGVKPGRRITPSPSAPAVPSVTVPFSMGRLKTAYSTGLRQSQSQVSPDLQLIGSLKSHGAWVCCHGNKLETINTSRIEESVLYHRLMKSHALRTERLESPIQLTESNINTNGRHNLYSTLVAMAEQGSELTGSHHRIVDERLTQNGFDVQCVKSSASSEQSYQIVGQCPDIPFYGVADLREVLEQITVTRAEDVTSCRPLKVINYLKSEAVRMARSSPFKTRAEDVQELLDELTNEIPAHWVTCLHDRPFYHELYDLSNVTFSQTQHSQS